MDNPIDRGRDHVEAVLSHHGVKGMKWGVRKDPGHEGERVKTRKLKKLDKQWERENLGRAGWIKLHNKAADAMNNGEIDRINNDPKYKNVKDFTNFSNPLVQQYHRDMEISFNRAFAKAGVDLGLNPSGTKKFQMVVEEDGDASIQLVPAKSDSVVKLPSTKPASSNSSTLSDEDAIDQLIRDGVIKQAHEDEDRFRAILDTRGRITRFVFEEGSLKHYGVKGMKWGVRKDRTPSRVAVAERPGKRLKTSGGANQPASDDAKTAASIRQKAKASSTDSLSNEELRTLVNRMNLEQQYSNLSAQRASKGKKFISSLIRDPAKSQAQRVANAYAAERVGEAMATQGVFDKGNKHLKK